LWAADPEENARCDGEARQLQFDCFNWRNGLEHGDTGRDMFALTSICLLQDDGRVISQNTGCDWMNRKEEWSVNAGYCAWKFCGVKRMLRKIP